MLVNIAEYSMYIMVLLGLAAGIPVVWRQRERLRLTGWPGIVGLAAAFSAIGLSTTMLFAKFEGLLTGNGGNVSLYGSFLFGAPLVLILSWALKRSRVAMLDTYAVYVLPSLFLVRCNCIFSGCCRGALIPGGGGMRWPTREAELVFHVVVFVLLWRLSQKPDRAGELFPLLMIVYGLFRFVNEWFREGTAIGVGFHIAHVWSVLCVGIGASVFFELRARAEKKRRAGHRR